ncbi:hypothetical protein [Nonomuraea basaltis]|uniref:hypothetical protein n=1 Tax=Nonomuraea basaltis TaxID=2495887 RepID=UPI00110C6255|nr:hypothetical protein [Nonomuraea basaltis]TMR91135.1 hypothetical protein EJK15_51505 [Nonomuraea basaltis]
MPATRLPPALPRAAAAAALLLATASAAPAADAAPCKRHLKPSHTYHANRQTFTTDRLGRPGRRPGQDPGRQGRAAYRLPDHRG